MQYKIADLKTATVNTVNGAKSVWRMKFVGNPESVSAWMSEANQTWKVGDTIEGEIKQNGKYFNFIESKNASGAAPSAGNTAVLIEIRDLLKIVVTSLGKMSGQVQIEDENIPY